LIDKKQIDEIIFEAAKIKDALDHRYRYHAPTTEQVIDYQRLREAGKELALLFEELCPPSQELAVAHTQLETALFWANAAIARN
jgi:hypothetical protein